MGWKEEGYRWKIHGQLDACFFMDFWHLFQFLIITSDLWKKFTLPCTEHVLGNRGKINKKKKLSNKTKFSKNSTFLFPASHNESHSAVFPKGKFPQNPDII